MKVALIETGGTVFSQNLNGQLKLTNSSPLKSARGFSFTHFNPINIFSEDATPNDWIKIARLIEEIQDSFDGFLILHGTDTMAYTASYLSFQLASVSKPIVITGSNLPGLEKDSDSFKNIDDALIALKNISRGAFISFAGDKNIASRVHLGTRARKVFCPLNKIYSFTSVASNPVAQIENGQYQQLNSPIVNNSLNTNNGFSLVDWVKLYPGINLKKESASELVLLELYPSAVGPSDLKEFFKINKNKNIFTTTLDGIGISENYPSVEIIKEHSTNLAMTPEAAYVKIGWAAKNDLSLVEENITGEFLNVESI